MNDVLESIEVMMKFETLEQKVSYIMGREIAVELAKKSFPKMNIKIIQEAIMDTFLQKEWPFDSDNAESLKNELEAQQKSAQATLEQQKANREYEFFSKNALRTPVVTHSSGIQYEIIDNGAQSAEIVPESKVSIRHKTWLLNGQQVDGSTHLATPLTVQLHQVPLSWLIALKQMNIGATWRLYVPGHLAYKENAHQSVPADTAIIFDLHIESVT
ncbi:hypothetical protein BCU70_16235 [Vibrio sp. 10N.286.49.C2]|uniref:FKBP-type peptidyl-prolyl cis-trans isomerase N-terminal domain-containing protein n=1 Tax=unclassified Vibrio TaxID=2614977 RepID=UPI000CB0DB29|nr:MULTISPECIES: FKBP-type peptidyl-prolyl cis-trans isomerase N-terminal domain-containing protein [unclassified Vibrio]PMH37190.1 hypothetical protein BCU70_16235 [Vibrio sp. 10N.286.49.C2]PMH57335.1 hypothetical protein BCU66_04875 [Vibrio sp. 10N.286.49.B1]PMH80555.1 hypothetical protein BCU58_23345 [Vibrio sp. 10N.286.48.B7]